MFQSGCGKRKTTSPVAADPIRTDTAAVAAPIELTAAQLALLAELERRADATRALASKADWRYGSVEQLVVALGIFFVPDPHQPDQLSGTTPFSEVSTRASEQRLIYVGGFALTAAGSALALALGRRRGSDDRGFRTAPGASRSRAD